MNSGKAKTPRKGPDKPYPPSVSQPSGLARQTPILTPSNESYEAFVSSKTRPSPQSNPVNAAPPPYQRPEDYERSYPKGKETEDNYGKDQESNARGQPLQENKKSKKKERKETAQEKEDREREKEEKAAEKRRERKRYLEIGRQVARALDEEKVEKKTKKVVKVKQEIVELTSSEASEEGSAVPSEESSSSEEEIVNPKTKKKTAKIKRPVSPAFSTSSRMSTGSCHKSPSPPKQGRQAPALNISTSRERERDSAPPGTSNRLLE